LTRRGVQAFLGVLEFGGRGIKAGP
jgi:hypothetical protein